MKYSQEFLKDLHQDRNRIVYARVTALNFNESPIESIEGRVTQGSVSLAGNSSVRRTCNLTLVSEKTDMSNYIWSLNTKFKLEVGIENHVNSNYPDIIWFNQGIFLISSCSTALSSNSFTMTIQGKDKMCQLNGEIGGTFTSSIDFGKYEQVDEQGNVTYIPQLIKDIIREMVHAYGNEPFHNIIINDLEESALMMQEYRYKEPLFLLRQADDLSGEYERALLGGEQMCKFSNSLGTEIYCPLKELPAYDVLATTFGTVQQPSTKFQLTQDYSNYILSGESPLYCATKIEMGQVVGFIPTELTYTGDLIANIGETVVSVLDKIKNMLGDFEYFYNEEGQFIFQRQKTYINTAWTPTIYNSDNSQATVINSEETSYTYSFLGNELLTAFNNSPNLANLKNDYSVWGTRATKSGSVPVHMRYAIHRKPKQYTTIQVEDEELIEYNKQYRLGLTGQNSVTYIYHSDAYHYDPEQKIMYLTLESVYGGPTQKLLQLGYGFEYDEVTKTLKLKINLDEAKKQNIVLCDWREIIYQMALDFRKYNHLDDFQLKISKANPDIFPRGTTGYEQYYIDMEGFWRQLYIQELQYDANNSIKDDRWYYKKNIFYNPVITDETFIQSKDYETLKKLNNILQDLEKDIVESDLQEIKLQSETIAALLNKYNYNIVNNQVEISSQKHMNGLKYYYNESEGTTALPKYERAKLIDIIYNEDGDKEYIYSPIKSDTIITNDLFTQEINYEAMTQQELDKLMLFPGANLKSLFIIKDCGTKNDIQTDDEYYTIKELGLNDSMSEVYKKELFDSIDEKTTIEEIILASVQEPGNIYYTIDLVSDLNLIDDKTHLYTKTPYLLYKQVQLKSTNNEQNQPYYNIKYCNSVEEASYSDQIYYEFQGMYIDPILTSLTVLERKDERISTFYKTLSELMNYYSSKGKNALFTLEKEQLEQLVWAIKKLLYIQYVMPQVTITPKIDNASEEKYPETFESDEKPENIEGNPFEKDYAEFLENYYLFLEELNQKFDGLNDDFDSYDYKAFMSEQEFIDFYNRFTIYIEQTIENIQLICYLYSPGKNLTVKQNVGFDEFLYGPLIEQIQFNVNYLYMYPDNKTIEKKLHQANQLDHKVLLSLKETINKISSFKNRIEALQSYLDSYEFEAKEFYGVALALDKNNFSNYFYLEPTMCYSLSTDYYQDLNERKHWHRNVYEAPELLNFWIEFLDTEGELGKFSVQNIGPRQKVINDNTVKSIYYRNAPLVIFTTPGTERNQTGYRYIEAIEGLPEDMHTYKIIANSAGNPYADATDIPIGSLGRSEYKIVDTYDKKSYNYWRYEEVSDSSGTRRVWRGKEYDGIYSQLFATSGQGKSAKDAIDTLLYTHSYCIESTTITTMPVYHLQPNTRVYVYDSNTNIEGEYIIAQLTVPLTYNGTMNLTTTKAVDRII